MFRWNAIDAAAEPGLEVDGFPGLEHERKEEVLAELAVAIPCGAGCEGDKGACVDENGLLAVELDVEGGSIAEDPVGVEGVLHELEVEKCGFTEHGEGPFPWP